MVEALTLKQAHLLQHDVGASVDIILGAITKALSCGARVEIRGFGSFAVSRRPPRIGRNPKTGEAVPIPATQFPRFRPGKELRFRVQGCGAKPETAVISP